MDRLYAWWTTVPQWAKAILITALLGTLGWLLAQGVPAVMRWYYIRTLLKLEDARKQIRAEQERRWQQMDIDPPVDKWADIALERAARKACIPLWRAKRATRWDEIRRKYS